MHTQDNLPLADGENQKPKIISEEIQNSETPVDAENLKPDESSEAELLTDDTNNSHLEDVDTENATDAEDHDNQKRHQLPDTDFGHMSLEQLIKALEKLLHHERIQIIRDHVEQIKSAFNSQYEALVEEKKEAFLQEGGNELDFSFSLPVKNHFYNLYNTYKEKRNQYYKDLENSLQTNLKERWAIIEEVKSLLNVEENIHNTYQHFRDIQNRWKNAGPVPRAHYNDVWRTYHHHVEIFYDFMDLNKELRDLDFKHNLEMKLKIIERAEALKSENDIPKMFRELQLLHKTWKEELGPVAKKQREEVWDKFSEITKELHQKRQEYFSNRDKIHEENLLVKKQIIEKIEQLSEPTEVHREWQKRIEEVEKLRESFLQAGRVPITENETTWKIFKKALRQFNHNKNEYYKNLKKEQHDNLNKKMALLNKAEELKDSEDWDKVTPLMKQIQAEWKIIGHVPRQHSDKIWKAFKKACNHYFDRFHNFRKAGSQVDQEIASQKSEIIDSVLQLDDKACPDKDSALKALGKVLNDWYILPRTEADHRALNGKFFRSFDKACKRLGLGQDEIEMLRFNNRMEHLSERDEASINKERTYLRKRIEEVKDEIRQLENNIQFFNVSDPENPLFVEVKNNIERHRNELEILKEKLKTLRETFE